ncbi:MAG: class I SAM-dependent methyltransferase [Chitinophagaceae bacterium]
MLDTKKYWDERFQTNYDIVGVGDISLSVNYNRWSYRVTEKILRRLFKKYSSNKPNNKVLDIGCGTGFVVDIWQALNKKVTGVDISTTAIDNLSKKYPDYYFVESDIGNTKLDLPDNSFSMCSAASVLYHIVDDQAFSKALTNIHRVLEKDGIFIFSDNFIHDSQMSIVHQKCRTLNDYTKALNEAGFEIMDRVPNYFLMNDPVDSNNKFYPRVWNTLTRLSRKSKLLDRLIWPAVYPLELLLTSTMKESPAQEFMICKAIK